MIPNVALVRQLSPATVDLNQELDAAHMEKISQQAPPPAQYGVNGS